MDAFIPRVPPERNVIEPRAPARRPGKQKQKQEQQDKQDKPESAAAEEPRSPHEEGVGDQLDITA